MGDLLIVDYSPEIGKLVFSKEAGGALVVEADGAAAEAAHASEALSSGNAAMIAPEAQPAPARVKERQK